MSELDRPPDMPSHPVVITFPVQWGDQDAFGHVNNVVYFRWFESARIHYFRQLNLEQKRPKGIGPILASIKCDYKRQLTYPDTLFISATITEIGRTSLKMSHVIYSAEHQAIAAHGESVIVMYDYSDGRSVVVPDDIRQMIDSLEGRV
jgi:acyl-CoA thioester hydrolase